MKKALIYCSVASMIDQFNRDNLLTLQNLGFKVEVACNFKEGSTISTEKILKLQDDLKEQGIEYHHIPIPRTPFAFSKIVQSYRLSQQLFKEKDYHLIHLHSPIGAAIGRFAFKHSGAQPAKIIYTAHGFHFYQGAPLANWLVYYPIEYLLASETDYLITINSEDEQFARQHLKAQNIAYVPGVGINTEKFMPSASMRQKKRQELALTDQEIMLLSVGELNRNKNHQAIISVLPRLHGSFRYYICGQGAELNLLKDLVEQLALTDRVQFLGYRQDIVEILQATDIYCFPSRREGLSVALMEAMAAGLPCVVSDIRGNRDLIDAQGGMRFDLKDQEKLYQALQSLIDSPSKRKQLGRYNQQKMQMFDRQHVQTRMATIYQDAESELIRP